MVQINETLNKNVVELSFNTKIIVTETDVYIKSGTSQISTITIFDSIERILHFYKKLLYHKNRLIELRKLCISNSCIENIMKIAHKNYYFEFVKCFEIISRL